MGVFDATAKSLCHTNIFPNVCATVNIPPTSRSQHVCIHLFGCVYQVRSSILMIVLWASAASHTAAESPSVFCCHFRCRGATVEDCSGEIADCGRRGLVSRLPLLLRIVCFSRCVSQAASAEAPTCRDGRGPFIFAWCSADISHQFLSLSAIPFCLLTRLSTLLTLKCIFLFPHSMSSACISQQIGRMQVLCARMSVFPFHQSS